MQIGSKFSILGQRPEGLERWDPVRPHGQQWGNALEPWPHKSQTNLALSSLISNISLRSHLVSNLFYEFPI